MSEPAALSDDLHAQIKAACARGDEQAAEGRYDEAIAEYDQALDLIPEPRTDYEAATWVFTAIADACFLAGYNASALDALEYVMHCPDAIGNPFIHLRFGQVLFDEGKLERAADELMRAYMGGGAELFEDEDDKYLKFLGSRAELN